MYMHGRLLYIDVCGGCMQILADVGYSATTPGLLGILFVGIGMTIVIPSCSFVVTRNNTLWL